MIDPHRLAILREVARTGSFAGAAAALRHTPSAISQQIAALERGSGHTLVNRSTRGVTLTDAGRILLATADAVHAELRAAERHLASLTSDGPRALTVVTFPSAGEPLLAPALTRFSDPEHPIDLTVVEAEPAEALELIRDGDADLALVYHFHTRRPPRDWAQRGGGGRYVPLADDHLRLVVPAGHRLAGRPSVRLHEVADERWIQGWGDTGEVLDMLAATQGFRPQVACRSSDYRFMCALISADVGVALIPELALTDHLDVRAIEIAPSPIRYVGAYLPQQRRQNPLAIRLSGTLRSQP